MRVLLLSWAFVFGCTNCGGNPWPLSAPLDGEVLASPPFVGPCVRALSDPLRAEPGTSPCNRKDWRPVHLDADAFPASEVFFEGNTNFVRIRIDDEPRWVQGPASLGTSCTAFLRELGDPVHASFFADGDRAIVVAEDILAIQCSTRRVRLLDSRSATLEGCQMNTARTRYACHLDLQWDSAEFDPDGVELTGSFEPPWLSLEGR